MTNTADIARYASPDQLGTAVDVLTNISASASPLSSPVRALRANTAGTVTITTFAGNSRTLNFLAGETRFVGATHVTAMSGVTGLEGMI